MKKALLIELETRLQGLDLAISNLEETLENSHIKDENIELMIKLLKTDFSVIESYIKEII
jgi:hypothetical protein